MCALCARGKCMGSNRLTSFFAFLRAFRRVRGKKSCWHGVCRVSSAVRKSDVSIVHYASVECPRACPAAARSSARRKLENSRKLVRLSASARRICADSAAQFSKKSAAVSCGRRGEFHVRYALATGNKILDSRLVVARSADRPQHPPQGLFHDHEYHPFDPRWRRLADSALKPVTASNGTTRSTRNLGARCTSRSLHAGSG